MELAGYVESVQIRHLKVQQNQIGRRVLHSVQSFFPTSGFATNLPSALLLEDGSQVVPHGRIVVYHKNSHQGVLPYQHFKARADISRRLRCETSRQC